MQLFAASSGGAGEASFARHSGDRLTGFAGRGSEYVEQTHTLCSRALLDQSGSPSVHLLIAALQTSAVEAKTSYGMALTLTTHFVYALDFLGELLQHPWRDNVVASLTELKNAGGKPLSGNLLKIRLQILLKEACWLQPGLSERFKVTEDAVAYDAAEGNFFASIESKKDGAVLKFEVGADRKSWLAYTFDTSGVKLTGQALSLEHSRDLGMLWADGALLIGALGLRNQLPESSPFYQASVEHARRLDAMRDQFKQAS